MSLEMILASIESSGEAEIDRLRSEAESRARQALEAAERKAVIAREEARRAALRPAAAERARRLHQAKLEALRTVGEVRQRLIEATLLETRQCLADLRADPDYPLILRRLIRSCCRSRRGGAAQRPRRPGDRSAG
jgi:vacuolar-type H+-ATPase subunit E/Vma4